MDEKKESERSFKTKVQVFFLYYKWYILIALFFVVFITVMTVQMCTRDEYDISVMYAGNAILSDGDSAKMENALESIGEKDEKAVLYELVIMSDAELSAAYDRGHSTSAINFEKVRKNREMFALNIMSDEYFILLLSPECYNIIMTSSALEKLADIGVNVPAEQLHSEYAIKFNTLAYAKHYTAFSPLPEDTLLCFKKISEMNASDKNKLKKREHDIALLSKMVNFSLSVPVAYVQDKEEFR